MKRWLKDIYWQLYKRNKKIDQLYVFPLPFSPRFRIWSEEDLYGAQRHNKLNETDLNKL